MLIIFKNFIFSSNFGQGGFSTGFYGFTAEAAGLSHWHFLPVFHIYFLSSWESLRKTSKNALKKGIFDAGMIELTFYVVFFVEFRLILQKTSVELLQLRLPHARNRTRCAEGLSLHYEKSRTSNGVSIYYYWTSGWLNAS